MPINLKKYPKNWKWLSKQIIQREGNKCGLCFAPNGVRITRDRLGRWWENPYEYIKGKIVKIVLTTHHINFDVTDNHPLNLIALCQRCHLRLDIREKLRKRHKEKHTEIL